MDALKAIRQPIEAELAAYASLFDEALVHEDDYLGQVLAHIRQRRGKMMRPILVLLMSREFAGENVGVASLRAAVSLELLHTASLVHDDVVDDSAERRGQPSANALFDNKVSILVGDFMLSRSLHQSALTGDIRVVDLIAQLGGTLSEGEVFQLANIRREESTEAAYFSIIDRKTAALFAACSQLGALTAGADEAGIRAAESFGRNVGICFQIRDDIFDYFDGNIGKPTGNDMREGKLTLPALYALHSTDDAAMHDTACRIKLGTATTADIEALIDFTKRAGGIDYAERTMADYRQRALDAIAGFKHDDVVRSLSRYVDYVTERNY